MDFTGFCWVLLGFTGFYWVKLGFAEFYWVLMEFHCVSEGMRPHRNNGIPLPHS